MLQQFKSGRNIRTRLQGASIKSLEEISQAIRDRILEVVSKNGGHLSSTLGAVELIVGMHAVYDCAKHPFIYDVSHQAYAHKLITGRYSQFSTLRQFGGISGFIAPYESTLDYFIAGHSSTSLSLAVGVAKARRLNIISNKQNGNSRLTGKPIAMIGDGAMSAGLVYEALNELGDLKLPVVILLNDNEMSIAKPIGVISKILSKTIASPLYQSMREKVKKIVEKMPDGTAFIAKRFEESFKLITPGLLFEEFGIDYIGPINGNNIEEVVSVLKSTQNLNRPVLIHCQTTKGKGYQIAEGRYEKWHGVPPFDLNTGKALNTNKMENPTQIFSKTLFDMAKSNDNIVGVTAAMPSGTGIDRLIDEFPDRFFDVAIAEQHAVTSMAAMAKEGFKPYIAIYSTFLQRAFDQIVHDVSIMNLPVVFCIDRAGLVGEDGETHQGLLDIAYLQGIPNIILTAPRDNASLEQALWWSIEVDSPIGIRYPRGKFITQDFYENNKDQTKLISKLALKLTSESPSHNKESLTSEALENKVLTADSKLQQIQKRRYIANSIISFALSNARRDYKSYLQERKAQMVLIWEEELKHIIQAIQKNKNDLTSNLDLTNKDVEANLSVKNHNSQDYLINTNKLQNINNSPYNSYKILLLGYGNGVGRAASTLESMYANYAIQADIMDIVFLKPLDTKSIKQALAQYSHIFVFSDNYKINGVGARVMQFAAELYASDMLDKIPKIISFEIGDMFVKHGKVDLVDQSLKLDSKSLARRIYEAII
ncbi:1-deoxy-D-xylulose-5-phosphate synthase [Helicobacter muridarum]|uniref:1-deoxy-D-xylulose-5-phosphate synthase n=1 Tax=Helicobacter muridarum TaxID=216 RepID=UPI0038B31D84